MLIIVWLLLGLAAGFIGSKIVNNTGRGILGDIVVGVLGALFGGFLFTRLGAEGDGAEPLELARRDVRLGRALGPVLRAPPAAVREVALTAGVGATVVTRLGRPRDDAKRDRGNGGGASCPVY
jgi:uncharacterized membrane protein YeaQ/YmgE (transglycosylase-associated protein family)